MKKLTLMLCLLLALPVAAQKKTFTVASLNVDGLPPNVKAAGIVDVKLNPEGPQAAGTAEMSTLISQKGWDFFGVSENFNYNTELMSGLNGVYNCGTYRGAIPSSVTNVVPYLNGTKWFDTDGLNLLWRSNISVSGEEWYLWNKRNGITEDGADQLIAKGYRYYMVRVAPGLEVDVYILHMDAETTEADNQAREIQMAQLVDMILASDNKRPIIVMGDTNCRYTRDRLKELMFDRINGDERFTMHDPWIDLKREGVYPSVGDPAIMVPGKYDGTNAEAFQTGEVVDKVFYIENTDARGVTLKALSYNQDIEFTRANGTSISDHYPIVVEFEIEKVGDALSGGEYYLRNIATNEFLAAGANYGTRSKVSNTGNHVTLEPGDADGQFYIKTTLHDNDKNQGYLGDNLYMDNGTKCIYSFSKIDGTQYYTISLNGQNLTVDADKLVQLASSNNPTDASQQWEMLTTQELIDELNKLASETNPMNATWLIRGAGFDRNDHELTNVWKVDKGKRGSENLAGDDRGISENDLISTNFIGEWFNGKKGTIDSSKSNCTISQDISNLPNGKYKLQMQGFTRSGNDGDTKNCYVTLNSDANKIILHNIEDDGQDTKINEDDVQRGGKWVPNSMRGSAVYFNKGLYEHELDFTITDHKLSIKIEKLNTSSEVWMTFDNFRLTYYGPTDEDLATLNRVKAAIDDARVKAEAAGLTGYDNYAVEDAYENRLISGDGSREIHNTYVALAKAAARQQQIPADMSCAILNNSFEMGDISEWDASAATNARVVNSEGEADGSYILNADAGEITHTFAVRMPAGTYELKALLSAGATLLAADRSKTNAPEAAPASTETLTETTLKFIHNGGELKIGVRGESAFAADNFRLTRLGDSENATAYDMVIRAIKDATERVNLLGAPYNEDWNLSSYQTMVDELTIEGDGLKEFNEIYGLLRAKVYSQTNSEGVSYTSAIINPSFEFGTTLGWDATFVGDTGVKPNSDATYTFESCDGDYLFNTWQDGKGTVLSQTIPGLPAGHYRLRATVAADQNSYIWFEANGQKQSFKIERQKDKAAVFSLEFDVAESTEAVTISVRGGNADGSYPDLGGSWYKIDKFELTRHGDTKVCFFYDRLQKAITRTDQIAATLPDKYRTQWSAKDYRDLFDEHWKAEHENVPEADADPMHGSNGLKEIEELYSRLRALIFSQSETGADMSGAITNYSFELGDMTAWNIEMEPNSDTKVTKNEDVYVTEGLDRDYLFNAYANSKAAPLTQTVKGVPAGKYRLSALVASDAGNRFYLAVNNTPGEMVTTGDKGTFQPISVEFEVTQEGEDILIGLYPSADGNFNSDLSPLNLGPWFKADKFTLTLLGRDVDIDWNMETDNYGTIMLPFEADIPAGLEVYSVIAPSQSQVNGGNVAYSLLTLQKADRIEANTPYLVKKTPADPVVRTASTTDGIYRFSGTTTHTKDTYKSGLLTGTFAEMLPAEGDHHLVSFNGNTGFIYHNGEVEHGAVAPYHAFITGLSETALIPALYFEEPAVDVDWTMEGDMYGTIILPFEADVPENLEVYTLSALGEIKSYTPKGETEAIRYQLITLAPADRIEANTPYIVKASEAGQKEFSFRGQATNTDTEYTGGLLTGVFEETAPAAESHILAEADGVGSFVPAEGSADKVMPNHAYVKADASAERAPLLLFEAPLDDTETGIAGILADGEAVVDIFTPAGMTVVAGAKAAEAIPALEPGLYIIRLGGKTFKLLKR